MEDWEYKYQQASEELAALRKKHVDFLEAASHDLHAPLRKIAVFADRISTKNASDPEALRYIDRMKNSVSEMQSLIDNLAALALANSGTIQYVVCDLNAIITKTLSELQEEIEDKKVVIHSATLPVVKGDAVQYKQLFINILENAVKYSKKNITPEIDITAYPVEQEEMTSRRLRKDQAYYKIVITDNGIGFRPEYAERIFEPFVRLHPKSDYPGTGLGLSIARKIVTNHNGIIYAEGKELVGAEFILILPANP
jgi:signal transduction histidine kinase